MKFADNGFLVQTPPEREFSFPHNAAVSCRVLPRILLLPCIPSPFNYTQASSLFSQPPALGPSTDQSATPPSFLPCFSSFKPATCGTIVSTNAYAQYVQVVLLVCNYKLTVLFEAQCRQKLRSGELCSEVIALLQTKRSTRVSSHIVPRACHIKTSSAQLDLEVAGHPWCLGSLFLSTEHI